MKKKMILKPSDIILIFMVLIAIILVTGCLGQSAESAEEENAKNACIDACNSALSAGQDLSNGPCLSNEIINKWVCDVAHWPRQDVDNDPANQCPEYGETASHFVEVYPNCTFIRAL